MYPAITQSSGAISSATTKVSDRIESRIDIIQVGVNKDDSELVDIWVKNTGTTQIDVIERCDIFWGPEDAFFRVDYDTGSAPYWDYALEGNNSTWQQAVTCKMTLHLLSTPSSGVVNLVKVVIPNGIADSTTFTAD